MHPIFEYDIYIFDCDGVILNSNKLKIAAMSEALRELSIDSAKREQCVDYFSKNFGRSRFHHVHHFLENILMVDSDDFEDTCALILQLYSAACESLYQRADITPGFIDFIEHLPGEKYVASGSEQSELRKVFKIRELDRYFRGIFGSPDKKGDLVAKILQSYEEKSAVMIGDAVSDYEASYKNNIDFVGYTKFSNVPGEMAKLSRSRNFEILKSWPSARL